MSDDANGALGAEELEFSDDEIAMLRGEEPEGRAEPVEEAIGGQEPGAGADPPGDAQGQPQGTAEPEKQRTVPHQALHEERERRRAIEAELRKTSEEKARYEERLGILLQWAQNQTEAANQANQPQIPDPNDDPIGYQNAMIGQLQQRLEQQQQWQQQLAQAYEGQQQQAQQQHIRQQMWNVYEHDVATFAAEAPDFNEAANYLQQVRMTELQAMGFDANAARQQLNNDFEGFVGYALQNGRRPSQALYDLAKARGYRAGASQQQQAAAVNAAVQGQQPQAQPQQAAQKLQNIAKGQAANKSLSGSGSGAPQPLDAATIAGMDDEEFASWYGQNFSDKKLQKMLGYQ